MAIPAVTEAEMRLVDHIAVNEFKLSMLQMMENAGRNLAELAMQKLNDPSGKITILAGSGGNGGGGLSCARHLHNHGHEIQIILSQPPGSLQGPGNLQMQILAAAGVSPGTGEDVKKGFSSSALIIDALVGYSLKGPPGGELADLIVLANAALAPILSLDLPSGMPADPGKATGLCIEPEWTLTLALPKIGLQAYQGELYLGDIGIPYELYHRLGLEVPPFPTGEYILPIYHRS